MKLRLMTYNVHRCVGVDKDLNVERVAAVIADARPDIVALQELDVGRMRTRGVDQAHALAELLGMRSRFHPAMHVEEEQYGDAILTALPERLVRAGSLPGYPRMRGLEPRGAIWVAVDVGGGVELQVINTHLGLVPREQRLQARALAGADWLGACSGPTLLAGDFNVTSLTQPYRTLCGRLADAQRKAGQRPTIKTFPSGFPAIRIDHCFVSEAIIPTRVQTTFSPLARAASDHLPLVVDFEIRA